MRITEVRVKLVGGGDHHLLAFCSITIEDAFVVRDLKLINGPTGPFVAMPSRKRTTQCAGCGGRNTVRSKFCCQCGRRLAVAEPARGADEGRSRLHADIAHPINAACRDLVQQRVLEEYGLELVRAREPGYTSRYEAVGDEDSSR